MSLSTQSIEITWGPGFGIGVTLNLVMFGVSICQVVLYYRSFPGDSRLLKSGVLLLLFFDILHTICTITTFWHILVSCHGATSSDCQMNFTWDVLGGLILNFSIALFVQSFYTHKVWIISGGNKVVTGAIISAAFLQILFGIFCVKSVFYSRNFAELFSHVYPALASAASSVCDMLITISVAYFLRMKNSRPQQRSHPIRRLKLILVELGLISFIVSALAVGLLVFSHPEARQYWACIPGPILGKAYFNSMLAVLNSRKILREQEFQARGQMIDLATIRNTNVNVPLKHD